MEEVLSNGEHCAWLAQQLRDQMGSYVSFNWFGITNPILAGVYDKNGVNGPYHSKDAVRFYIKFCKEEFLRIQIELGYRSNENVAIAMSELIKALASIKQGDTSIGLPLAIYEVGKYLTGEYAFKNKETVIEDLKNNTMFDDDHLKKLVFLGNCNNCIYKSSEEEKATFYSTIGDYDTETKENETCINHEFIDGEVPDIKVLCKSICDNKK